MIINFITNEKKIYEMIKKYKIMANQTYEHEISDINSGWILTLSLNAKLNIINKIKK